MRVCFVCPNAGPLFLPGVRNLFGGLELRARTIACGLARRAGYSVDFVVETGRDEPARMVDGVTVHPLAIERPAHFLNRAADQAHRQVRRIAQFPWWQVHQASAGLAWRFPLMVLRDVLWRVYEDTGRPWIGRKLMALVAEAYCCSGVHRLAADVFVGCRRSGRIGVLFITSDAELGPHIYRRSHERGTLRHMGHPAWVALHTAHCIVAQNDFQQAWLRERGLPSLLMPNPIDLESQAEGEAPLTPGYVLWVGRADSDVKRPRLGFEVARRCPQQRFLMIVNPVAGVDQAKLRTDAPANVTLVDHVPHADIERYFRHAGLLMNTSAFEGFPNAFIQAAKYGVPVASLVVDPQGMLGVHGCGAAAGGDVEVMAANVRRLMEDGAAHEAAAQAALRYVRTYHDLQTRLDDLVKAIEEHGRSG